MGRRLCCLLYLLLSCCVIINTISAEGTKEPNATTVEEFLKNQIEVIDNATSEALVHDVININRKPTRILCNQTNTDSIKIFKKAEGFIYILSSNELLAIDVNEDKDAQLHFVGRFAPFEEPVIEIQIEQWQNMIVVILKLSKSLHVYLTKNDFVTAANLEPIQKIDINSPSDRFVLFKNRKDVFMVTYGIKSESANELIFFKWKTSFFSKESQETVDLPIKSNLFIFNENVNEPLILSIGFEKNTTRVMILKLIPSTKRWTKLQSLHFKQDYIEHYVIDGQLYLIGCSTESFCAIYKWTNSQFRRHLKINTKVFEKIKNVNYQHDIIITENFQNGLTFYTSDDIVTTRPSLSWESPQNIVDYAIFQSKTKHLYFVEFVFTKTSLAINFYDMTIRRFRDKNERADDKVKDAVDCIARLKAYLKNRIPQVQLSHNQAHNLIQEGATIDLSKKRSLSTRSINVIQSKIQQFKMPYNLSMTGTQLQERVSSTNIQVSETRRALNSSPGLSGEGRAADGLENIVVENLIHNGKDFTDLLLSSQKDFVFSGNKRMRDLIANKLVVRSNRINEIELKDILNKTSTKRIAGTRRLKALRVTELTTPLLNNVPLKFLEPSDDKSFELSEGFEFQGDINVKHLEVKSLNGFNVSALFQHIFLQRERSVIKGNLIVQNATAIEELEVKSLSDMPVDKLMTTATDQQITANVFINKFHVNQLTTRLINDENLSNNVALNNSVNIIEVPTQFLTLHVLQNLNVLDDEHQEGEQRLALEQTIESFKRQVIGTQTSDLSQIYNGQVVIEGSLVVKDVHAFSPKTRIVVNDKEVAQNISNHYWMKSLKQNVRVEKFTIANPKMSGGSVVASLLHGHPVQEFVLTNSKAPRGIVHLRFENALVEGDVSGHKGNVPSLIFHIHQTAVARRGPQVIVEGSIEFREKLTVRKLLTNAINDSPIKDLVVATHQLVDFAAPKTAKEVKVGQLLISDSIAFDHFNNVDIKNFQREAKRIDQPLELVALKLETFSATNLNTQFFESHQFNEFIKTLENQFQAEAIKRNLKIVGNVEFQSKLILNKVNGKTNFNDFISLLVLKTSPSSEIGGRKTFRDLAIRNDLFAKSVNDFPLDRLLHKSLSRNDDKQIITGEFFAKNLKTKALSAKSLNEIHWNQFVDITRLHLPLLGNFRIGELKADNVNSMASSFDLVNVIRSLQHPKRGNWTTITAKLVESSPQKSSHLDRMISSAVFRDGPSQLITGKVQIDTDKVYIKKLYKKDGTIIASLNAINIFELFADSVKNESQKVQVISGINSFLSPIYVIDLKVEPSAYFESKEINNINVEHFNQSIVRPRDIIHSEKTFAHLHAEEIEVKGKVNGIPIDSIVFVINNAVQLPSQRFDCLEVNYIKTFTFNDYSLLHFLEHRMRKFDGPAQELSGFVVLEDLELRNNSIMSSINRMPIDDIVYHQSDQLQEIVGHVSVLGNITLKGPSIIRTINEIDFVDFIKSSVSRHQNHVTEALKLPAVELKNGLATKHFINGHRINELLSSDAHIPKVADLLSLVEHVQDQIGDIDNFKRSKSSRSKRLLYIDYDPEVEITYDGNRRQCADKIVEASRLNSITVREKRESEMIVDLKLVTVIVKPNLQCRQGSVSSQNLEIWWTHKNDPNAQEFMRNFSFTNLVSDVKFLESKRSEVFIILTMANQASPTSEIGFMRLFNDDWFEAQPVLPGFNQQTKTAVVDTPKHQFLVVSSFDETSPSDYISILRFDEARNEFIEHQPKFSGEKFDIILGVNILPKSRVMRARTFLILAREGGRVLYIYRLKDDSSQEFAFQRKIPFESEIVEVVVLHITDGPYFIVSLQTGDFCLFEWRGIESWKVKQCGHFSSINRIKTYEYLKRQHLFLASTLNTGTALTVHRQGDLF